MSQHFFLDKRGALLNGNSKLIKKDLFWVAKIQLIYRSIQVP